MTAATHAVYERYHACWAARDPERIAAMHTTDSVFHLHSGLPPARGREEIRAAAAANFAQVPDLDFELVSLNVGDGFWAVRFVMTGTSPSGDPFQIDLADVVLVRDGLVAEKHSYVDGVAMQAALRPAAAVS